MQMSIQIDNTQGNVFIGGIELVQLLKEVFQTGIEQGKQEKSDMVTFQQLSKELEAKGRKIGVQTLTKKAREANVEVVPFDGKRLAVSRRSVKHFISEYETK